MGKKQGPLLFFLTIRVDFSLQPSGTFQLASHVSLLLDNRNGTFILALQLLGAVRATDFSGAKVFRGATS